MHRKSFIIRVIFFLFCCSLFFIPKSFARRDTPEIRISIIKDAGTIKLESKDMIVRNGRTGRVLLRNKDSGFLIIRWWKHGMRFGSEVTSAPKLIIQSKSQSFRLYDRTLQGELEVRPNGKGGLSLVNQLPLERYLVGLINHEISSTWPMESLKAQAVVARTYALYRKQNANRKYYDLESTTLDQVYGGSHREDRRSMRAVRDTRGEVLTVNGNLVSAFYHSCCGGSTDLAQNVWGTPYEGFRAVKCEYCTQAPQYFWIYKISVGQLRQKLSEGGHFLESLEKIRVVKTTPFGRALLIRVRGDGGQFDLSGNQFRRIVGFQKIKSTLFRIQGPQWAEASLSEKDPVKIPVWQDDSKVQFIGGGNDHGVGMCQWGARGMAEKGFSYKDIIRFYYPEARLKRGRL